MDKDFLTKNTLVSRGQVGREWVYYVVDGYQRTRAYKVPTDPESPHQLSKRAHWSNGVEWWHNESPSFRSNYDVTAKNLNLAMTGFNLFMRDWSEGVYVTEVIKGVQTGTKLCNDGANDVTINAVALAKSIVIISSYHCGSSLGVADEHGICGAELTSTTNLRIHAVKGAQASQPSSCWQVIEFY